MITTMPSQFTKPASRLFTQPFIQTQIKENIKASRHWPLCGEFTGTGEFPAQRASCAENVSISWRHRDITSVWVIVCAFTYASRPWITGTCICSFSTNLYVCVNLCYISFYYIFVLDYLVNKLSLSVSFCLFVSLCLSMWLSPFALSVSASVCLSLSVSVSVCLCLFLSVSVSVSCPLSHVSCPLSLSLTLSLSNYSNFKHYLTEVRNLRTTQDDAGPKQVNPI